MTRKKLVIIDGNSLANRAFYAIQAELTTKEGEPTNAVYGFANMLVRLMDEEKPDMLAVAFDKSGPTFRHMEYDGYKATRKGMPDELSSQMPLIKELLSTFRIPVLEIDGYEADDVIGTVAKKSEEAGHECLIVTGDKDALQLVSDLTRAMLTKRGISEMETYDAKAVEERLGVGPQYVPDVKGLAGDVSDNIPGVPGIGEKTAVKLIQALGYLEDILDKADSVKSDRTRRLLKEHEDQARLSKRLATIDREVPIEFNFSECYVEEPDWPALVNLLKRLEFRSLIKRFEDRLQDKGDAASSATLDLFSQVPPGNVSGGGDEAPGQPGKCVTVEDIEGVLDLVRELSDVREFAFETIPDSNDPMRTGLTGMAIAHPDGRGSYLPFAHMRLGAPAVPEREAILALKPLFEDGDVLKVCHDAKTRIIHLRRRGVKLSGPVFDTMIAAYLVSPDQKTDVENVIRDYLGDEVSAISELVSRSGRGGLPRTIGETEADNVRDVVCAGLARLPRLQDVLSERLSRLGMDRLFLDVEMPLVRILADMEMAGVKVDPERLRELSADLGERLAELEKEIFRLAGDEFNINSPKQLSFILFEKLGLPPIKKTKTGYSTDAEVLEALSFSHDIAEKILDYRELTKLKSTYADALGALINPETGRIHTTFNQAVTSTGRLSSSDPNLQNIPVRTEEGRKIRAVFIPGDEHSVILSADYSQIELRVLAHFAKDEILVESFRKGEDVHARTAAKVFGVGLKDVTPEMRTKAKAVNFGIIYGISDFGLARGIKITRGEASRFIDSYFHHYKGVREFLDTVVEKARDDGYVTTLLSRRRYLPELRSKNVPRRKFAERTAMNTPIQGTAADIIKLAMVDVARGLETRGLRARMILQVHDELVFDVPKDELREVADLVRETMESAVDLDVPLKVDVKAGRNWLELVQFA
ncbi:MAG TPA: DNA polymerase I [Firmicutes bacterium]|nr:DNA polymerase I [Bacillota bacterium]